MTNSKILHQVHQDSRWRVSDETNKSLHQVHQDSRWRVSVETNKSQIQIIQILNKILLEIKCLCY